MKKILLFLFIITACQPSEPTRETIIRQQAEAALKKTMNDPDSYEFVSLVLIDSVTNKENMDKHKKNLAVAVYNEEERIANAKELPRIYDAKKRKEFQFRLDQLKKIDVKMDSIELALGDELNEVVCYNYALTFRGKNAFGGKVMNTYYLQVHPGPSYNIFNASEKESDIKNSLLAYPGYNEVIVPLKAQID